MSKKERLSIFSVILLSSVALFGGGGKELPRQSPELASEPPNAPSSGTALLESGPVTRYGILVLPANAISHEEGVYTDGPATITVRYTEDEILIPADWVTSVCGSAQGSTRLRFTLEESRLHFVYPSPEEWAVLFDFPDGYEKTCEFIERFLQRLRYFKSVSKDAESVPFPAIVEVPPG